MSKKLNIKIKDFNKKEFELLEQGNIGDYFSLNDVDNIISVSDIEKTFKEVIDLEVDKKVLKEKINWENAFKNSNEYLNLNKTMIDLENEIKNLKENKNKEIELFLSKKELEFNDKLNSKVLELNNKNKEIENLELSLKLNKENETNLINSKISEEKVILEQKLNGIINQKDKEIEKVKFDLQNKIDILEKNKSVSSKLLGEELENWIKNTYSESFGMIEDAKLTKANDIIDGTKPDFIFETIDSKTKVKLVSVTIEAKSQGFQGVNSHKNKDFFEKLHKDRIKNQSEYALLISELEMENNFSIVKVNDYENMYIVRPAFFIPFLALIRSIGIKKSEIIKTGELLKEKQEIIDLFDKEKEEIIINVLDKMKVKFESISTKANIIIKSANDIIDLGKDIVEKHMETLVKKIEKLSILKPKNLKMVVKINEEIKVD